MNKIIVDLENCYGIGHLNCEFDFTNSPVHAVYAPNGIMKTSFARTFRDASNGVASSDQIFPGRVSSRILQDETESLLRQDQILVISPYEENYQPKEISTLLVDAGLKAQYDQAVAEIEMRKKSLLAALKSRSGLTGRTVTAETELVKCFGGIDLIDSIDDMIEATKTADSSLSEVAYGTIFGEKSVQFLSSSDALKQIEVYVKQFDELVSHSSILTPQFNHTNASAIQKSLLDGRFFEANHWVTLNGDGAPIEVHSAAEMKERVESEIRRVLSDDTLHKAFEAFDKKIAGNAELRDLRSYLHEHQELISRLKDLPAFRRAVWTAFLAENHGLLADLHAQYGKSRAVIDAVVGQAHAQATEWEIVVNLFNQRFSVPFRLKIENQADVILKEQAPHVVFEFSDGDGTTPVQSPKDLLLALSQGERRALYLLNVIFDLRIKERAGGTTLIIVDDIADSFDYRNKYAIIEYLQDVCKSGSFRLIILSHNFDFHRSASSRIGIKRQCRRIAVRAGREIKLVPEKYQKNPLTHWRANDTDIGNFIASIPFVRNLAEYCGHEDAFAALTETLHIKAGTRTLTLASIDSEYAKVINSYSPPSAPSRNLLYWDMLAGEATRIAAAITDHAELESKLVLSICIRLKAEEYMIAKISDSAFVSGITSNQTNDLLQEYRNRFPGSPALNILGQVQLMTPENLHLNSFMFEPLIDLGIHHLRRLYLLVAAL